MKRSFKVEVSFSCIDENATASDVDNLPADIQKEFGKGEFDDAINYYESAKTYFRGAVRFDSEYRSKGIRADVLFWVINNEHTLLLNAVEIKP